MKFLPLVTVFLMGCSFDLAALRVAQVSTSDATQVDASVPFGVDAGADTSEVAPDAFAGMQDASGPSPDAFTAPPDAHAPLASDAGTDARVDARSVADTGHIDTGGFNLPCSTFGAYQDCGDGGRQVCDGHRWSTCT